MNEIDLKFTSLNEDENQTPKKESKVKLTDELLDQANKALDKDRLADDSVKKVINAIFGDSAIYPDSNPDQIKKNVDKFIKIAEEKSVLPNKEENTTDIDENVNNAPTQNVNYEHYTPYPLINESAESIRSKIKTFISKWLDKIMESNKSAQENKILKRFYTKVKQARDKKAAQDKSNKQNARSRVKRPKTLNELKNTYIEAGQNFVAHTCSMTYKLLKSTNDKKEELATLAKELGRDSDDSDKYLKDIKDINERKMIDAATFAIGLAKNRKEANADKKLPQDAKNTKEALRLAARYKKAFPKYYQNAMNVINDSYTEGIHKAQKMLREGDDLTDPITGEKVNRELIHPLWEVGQSLNNFFTRQPINSVTLIPKLIFGVYNALTSKPAKAIYSGLFKFSRAIYQSVTIREQRTKTEDNAELYNCDVDSLTKEFDELVKQHSNDEDEVDRSK